MSTWRFHNQELKDIMVVLLGLCVVWSTQKGVVQLSLLWDSPKKRVAVRSPSPFIHLDQGVLYSRKSSDLWFNSIAKVIFNDFSFLFVIQDCLVSSPFFRPVIKKIIRLFDVILFLLSSSFSSTSLSWSIHFLSIKGPEYCCRIWIMLIVLIYL